MSCRSGKAFSSAPTKSCALEFIDHQVVYKQNFNYYTVMTTRLIKTFLH